MTLCKEGIIVVGADMCSCGCTVPSCVAVGQKTCTPSAQCKESGMVSKSSNPAGREPLLGIAGVALTYVVQSLGAVSGMCIMQSALANRYASMADGCCM